ncbi:tumor necrosis factor receptor superfamily member 5-like [Hemitrygon akajei]|uniref:tumor necrosis factor receptor superfamily member 5-like n=1 Tax=Hemitrygon akajei TaxID=2704970 RepID=UPI003BFA3522
MGIPNLAILFAGYLILLLVLIEASHANDCTEFEYKYKDWCCPLCEAGMRVSEHCTRQFSTQCEQCPDGEYSDRDTGSEKCLECKSCDQELGLQIEQPCSYTHDTICEPMTGYYCTENCLRAKQHTACPAGLGVKEEGIRFKDTVCEKCSYGTFSNSNSSTEECKNWTVCETLKLKQVEPGSAEADVKCEAERNRTIAV